MRFKNYGRNSKLRKAYVQSPGLLMVGVDIGRASHSACFGTKTGTVAAKFDFAHTAVALMNLSRQFANFALKPVQKGVDRYGTLWFVLVQPL